MASPFDLAQAEQLASLGHINADQLARIQAQTHPVNQAEVTLPAPQSPAPSSMPMDKAPKLPEGVQTADFVREEPVTLAADAVPAQQQASIQTVPYDSTDEMAAYQQALAAPYLMRQQAIAEGVAAGEAKGAETAAYLNRVQREQDQMSKTHANAEAERQAKLDAQLNLLNTKAKEISETTLDPKRLYKNMSTGDKILAGIGMFLGAFGQNGKNSAVEVIDKAVQQDIALQKSALDSKQSEYVAQRGIYADMVATFKDRRLAEDASRLAYLNNAQLKLQEIASKFSGREAQAKAMDLYGQLESAKQQAQLSFMANYQKAVPQTVSATTSPENLTEDQRSRFVPGFGLALTKDDAKELKAYTADYENARSTISQLKNLSNKSLSSVSIEDRAQADVLASMLKGSLRLQILGPGAVSDQERKMLDAIVANPTAIFSLDTANKSRLDTLLNSVNRNLQNKLKSYGLQTPESRLGITKVSQ
jgi:hypothetical protein